MADKSLAWFMTCLMWAGPAFGMSVAPKMDCPTQFRALASEVSSPAEGSRSMALQRVTFSIEESLKGDYEVHQDVSLEFVKFGSLDVEAGRQYLVQLNHGRLCWLEAVN